MSPDERRECEQEGMRQVRAHERHEARIRADVAAMDHEAEDMVPATWGGLLTILEAHYPEDVFDGSSGDPGPHIIALCRAVERLAAFIEQQVPGSQVHRGSGLVIT